MKKIKIYFILCIISFSLFTFSSFAQFSFIHITDLHIADGLSAGTYDLNGVKFKQMLDAINNMNTKPAFVIATGDISHAGEYGTDGMYPSLTQYLYPTTLTNPNAGEYFIDAAQTIPIYFTPGNHDFRTGNLPPLSNSFLNYYKAFVAPDSDYVITYQNALILCLNSGYDDLRPLWEDTNYMTPEGSGLTSAQCSWSRNILSANPGKKKIIAMHHPPVDVTGTNPDGSPWTGTILDPGDGSIKYNRTTLLDICDSNNVDIVIAGHQHMNVVADQNANVVSENWAFGTRYIQTAACMDLVYRIITVDTSFVWVSTPQIANITGIDSNFLFTEKIQLFNFFYNPLLNKIYIVNNNEIVSKETNISIFNITGKQIISAQFKNQNQIEINANFYAKGIYILKVQTENNIINKKLIINK